VPTVQTFRAWAESLEDATYYTVLRVPVDATPAAIKEAFHAIALRCHPDRFVDEDDALRVAASSVFKRAVEAYRVLSRPELRAEYDRALAAGARRHDPGASMPASRVEAAADRDARGPREDPGREGALPTRRCAHLRGSSRRRPVCPS
jgi:curved DNA-binding protein CbpA